MLDVLAKKWSARGRLDRLEVHGLTLVELRSSTQPLGKLLARTVASGSYNYSPLVAVEAHIDGKRRILHRPNLLDRVVLTVVARYLSVLSEPFLLPVLHSYRKGRSPWKAIATLRAYLQEHRARVPLTERGLFVLRRDVQKYGESIDTGPKSTLWQQLERILGSDPEPKRRRISERLVVEAIRQPVLGSDDIAVPLPRGVPTGSPIQPPCANLYLSSIDEYCSKVADGFYSRFGDDILFCHADATIAQQVSQEIDARLETLGLTSKQEKRRDLDFNGAGRSRDDLGVFRACNQIEYLGANIDFVGNSGLKYEKVRAFENALRQRFRHLATDIVDMDRDTRIRVLCETVRAALEPADPMSLSQAESLQHMVTQRSQLRDLDDRIALMVAELVAGRRGRRAFRTVPYRELRHCGLPSLVARRDRNPVPTNGEP